MKIRTIGFAERMFGFREKEVHFERTKMLSEVLDFTDIPINLISIIVNERAATKDHEVKTTDKVIITQIVAGG